MSCLWPFLGAPHLPHFGAFLFLRPPACSCCLHSGISCSKKSHNLHFFLKLNSAMLDDEHALWCYTCKYGRDKCCLFCLSFLKCDLSRWVPVGGVDESRWVFFFTCWKRWKKPLEKLQKAVRLFSLTRWKRWEKPLGKLVLATAP